MVAQHRAVETAHRLLASETGTSDGFVTLYEGNRLNLSIEARVLEPWYQDLFSGGEGSLARFGLQEHRFNMGGYLADTSGAWPDWATQDI